MLALANSPDYRTDGAVYKVTSRGLPHTMGRELRSLGKVEEGGIIRAQCHTEFEPQVFRHHGHLACTNKHTHTRTHT